MINRAMAHYICICISLHCPLSVVVVAANNRRCDASQKNASIPFPFNNPVRREGHGSFRVSSDPPFLPFAKNASSPMSLSPVPSVC
jgi:hypothetical protein